MPTKKRRYLSSLTAEQTALLPVVRDEWINEILFTRATDRAKAERAVDDAYRAAGLEPPKLKIWNPSPLGGSITLAILRKLPQDRVRDSVWDSVRDSVRDSVWDSVRDSVRASVGDSVWDSVWDSVGDSVWDSVGASVRASVWASVRDSVWDSVWASVRASVWDSVRASVWDSVWDSVRDSVRDSVWDSVRDSVSSYWNAGWLAFYDAFDKLGLSDLVAPLRGMQALSQETAWWFGFKDIVILTERHTVIARDDQGRLHSTDGPAIAYGDGFAIFAIHGVRLANPDFITDRSKLTIERIRTEQNAEVRRAMIGLYGAERYLRDSGAKEIHKDECGRLLRTEIPGDEALVMVQVVNSTPEPIGYKPEKGEAGERRGKRWFKHYTLRVPPNTKTAREAVAWTFGMTADEYKPLVET